MVMNRGDSGFCWPSYHRQRFDEIVNWHLKRAKFSLKTLTKRKESPMITRLRHLCSSTAQREEQMQEGKQQPTPVYDAIAQALRSWDILRIVTYHNFAYEADVLWLLQHLPTTSHSNDVEELLKERFAEQQGSPQCDPEDALRMKALADDMWHAWSQYLHRNEQSTFSQARSRARGLMRRHDTPRTHSR
jgi:hypothetical protein